MTRTKSRHHTFVCLIQHCESKRAQSKPAWSVSSYSPVPQALQSNTMIQLKCLLQSNTVIQLQCLQPLNQQANQSSDHPGRQYDPIRLLLGGPGGSGGLECKRAWLKHKSAQTTPRLMMVCPLTFMLHAPSVWSVTMAFSPTFSCCSTRAIFFSMAATTITGSPSLVTTNTIADLPSAGAIASGRWICCVGIDTCCDWNLVVAVTASSKCAGFSTAACFHRRLYTVHDLDQLKVSNSLILSGGSQRDIFLSFCRTGLLLQPCCRIFRNAFI